ncbi:hypothetical protein MASR1M31_19920 [Porphyromonadaceae bacterium]
MKIKGSEAFVQSLINEGTDTVFGYPGGAIMPVFDSLFDHKDKINHILVRHEHGATHAPQGYARVSGKTGVVIVTRPRGDQIQLPEGGCHARQHTDGSNLRTGKFLLAWNRRVSRDRHRRYHPSYYEVELSD